MSADMDYEATMRKVHEVYGKVDFSSWTGRMVGEHLYKAGQARMAGKHYDFPGYIAFPITKFDNKNKDHLPFVVDAYAWNHLIVMENGVAEWADMRDHFKKHAWLVMEQGKHMIMAMKRNDKTRGSPPQQQDTTDTSTAAQGPQIDTNIRQDELPMQFNEGMAIAQPSVVSNAERMPHRLGPQQQDTTDTSTAAQGPLIGITNDAIRQDELPMQFNEDMAIAQPSVSSNAERMPDISAGLNSVVPQISMEPQLDVAPPDVELVTDQVMVNHGFGNEDVAALRRDAIDEFGDAPTHNQRELQEIINNLDNVADERSPETSSIANIANLASRPIIKARRRTRATDRTTDPKPRQEIDYNELRELAEATQQLLREQAVVSIQPAFTSTPQRGQNDADPNAIPTSNLAAIIEMDTEIVLPQPPANDSENQANAKAQNVNSFIPAAQNLHVAPDSEGATTILPSITGQGNQNQENVAASLEEHGLPRQRDPDAADRVMKRVIGGLGRIRYRSYPRPVPVPPQVTIQRIAEDEVTMHPRLGNRSEFSMYYDRVFDLLADNDVVPIQHYLRDLNDAQRFSALTALADIASDGTISIEREGANGPPLRFRREN